jgi:transposase-like protein
MKITQPEKAPGAAAGRAKRPRRSAAEWATIVARWKRSGKTSREYAAAHGLEAATLLWWSSQGPRGGARAAASATRPAPAVDRAATSGPSGTPAFLPVQVTGRCADDVGQVTALRVRAEVLLGGGRRVRLRGELTLPEFVRLLDAMEGGAAC